MMQEENPNSDGGKASAELTKRCLQKYALGYTEIEICESENISRQMLRNIFFKEGPFKRVVFNQRRENEFNTCFRKALLKSKKHNRLPTIAEMKEMNIPNRIWKEIRDELKNRGYEVLYSPPKNKLTDEELIAELKRLHAQLKRTPGLKDINKESKFYAETFINHFGSLTNAQKEAGLKPNKRGAQKGNMNWVNSVRQKRVQK